MNFKIPEKIKGKDHKINLRKQFLEVADNDMHASFPILGKKMMTWLVQLNPPHKPKITYFLVFSQIKLNQIRFSQNY